MKTRLCIILSALGLLLPAVAGSPSSVDMAEEFKSASLAEWPAKAVVVVSQAEPASRSSTAGQILAVVSRLKQSALPSVAASLAKAHPSLSAPVAVKAVGLDAKAFSEIIRAVVSAVPAQSSNIVFELCSAFPARYVDIVTVTVRTAPDYAAISLSALAAAIPHLAEPVRTASRGVDLSVRPQQISLILQRVRSAEIAASSSEVFRAPPTIKAPYTPPSTTPVQTDAGNSTPVGPRDYSLP